MNDEELLELKQRLAPGILSIPGVSGLGIQGGALAVYLEQESGPARAAVSNLLRRAAAAVSVEFVVTGAFGKQ
jgi:hypothetical protein